MTVKDLRERLAGFDETWTVVMATNADATEPCPRVGEVGRTEVVWRDDRKAEVVSTDPCDGVSHPNAICIFPDYDA